MNLVTQQVVEQPLIILLGEESRLSVWIEEFLHENGLYVERVSPNDEIDFKKYFEDRKENTYKIIWLHSIKEYKQNKHTNILSILSGLEVKIVTISRIGTNFFFNDQLYLEYKKNILLEKEFIKLIFKNIPDVQVLLGQDLLGDESSLSYPLLFSVQDFGQKKIIDPQIDWSLLTPFSFFEAIKQQLIKPHTPGKFLIKGQKINSTEVINIIKKLYKQYFNLSLKVIKSFSEMTDNFTDFIIVTQKDDYLEEYLDHFVRFLPSFNDQLKSLKNNRILSKNKVSKKSLENSDPFSKIIQKLPNVKNKTQTHIKKTADSFLNVIKPAFKDKLQQIIVPKKTPIRKKTNKTPIDQVKGESSVTLNSESTNQSHSDPNYGDKLQEIFTHNRVEFTHDRVSKKTNITKKIFKKSKRNKIMFFGGLSIIISGIVISLLLGFYQLTLKNAQKEVSKILSNGEANSEIDEIKSIKSLSNQVQFYSNIFQNDVFSEANSYIKTIKSVNKTQQSIIDFNQSIIDLYMTVVVDGMDIKAKIERVGAMSESAYQSLSKFSSDIDDFSIVGFSYEDQKLIEDYIGKIDQQRSNLVTYPQVQGLLPNFLSLNGKKTYAVVLQNNLELRPTGGFIQAIALVTFKQGLLVDTQVYSVYEVDDKLMSQIQPPEEIKRILGEERWFLRDSNWDPDFPTTAKRITWFIKESLGITLDGVIALNYSVIEDILEKTGPLEMDEFNEVLTSRNLFERLEFHSGSEFQQKNSITKDYHSLITQRILKRLKSLDKNKIVPVLEVFRDSLDNKQLLVYYSNEEAHSISESLGWTGSLIDPECPSQLNQSSCFVDSMYQVEANVGLNKVNSYINRSISHTIKINTNKVIHKRIITYVNNAKSAGWPQGDYKAFVRFYSHGKSKLSSIVLNKKKLSENNIVAYNEKGKNVYAFLVEVPRQKTIIVEVNYEVDLPNSSAFSYVFFDQKQPGVINNSLKTYLSYDEKLNPLIIAPQANIDGSLVTFEPDDETHAFVGVSFE